MSCQCSSKSEIKCGGNHYCTIKLSKDLILSVYDSSCLGQHNSATPRRILPNSAKQDTSSFKTPPSPAQLDPFYTQGENLTSNVEIDETWVTIFG